MYNLPPWLCMKCKYIMMPILIQGPKQPGNDIDVFMEPLMEDFATLWNQGVEVWDEYKRQYFQLRALVFVTTSDYPDNDNLSGHTIYRTNGLHCLSVKNLRSPLTSAENRSHTCCPVVALSLSSIPICHHRLEQHSLIYTVSCKIQLCLLLGNCPVTIVMFISNS